MVDEDVPCEDVLAQITLPAEQKKADIGIAMGGVGSDIALDAADIALVDDEVKELPHLIALSRRMMITIKCNMSFSMGLNFVAIVLAIIGILNPVVGALVHFLSQYHPLNTYPFFDGFESFIVFEVILYVLGFFLLFLPPFRLYVI